MKRAEGTLFVLALLGVFTVAAWADPVLPHLISDHAVFQQEREIRISGTADPAEHITVSLSTNSSQTQADVAGRWEVRLPAMRAGGPFTLRVSGKKVLEVRDVLIGEVWIASGQSNMTFSLNDSTGAGEELPKADYPEIRLFNVPRRSAASEQRDTLPASWQVCNPDTAKSFSAVAYYFARDLYLKLHVPIGIIESAWPGTMIEEWIAPEAAARDRRLKSLLDEWSNREGKGFVASRQPFALEFDDFELLPEPGSQAKPLLVTDFDDGSTRTTFGGSWWYDFRDAPETSLELSAPGHTGQGYAARVMGRIDASDDARLHLRLRADGATVDLSSYGGIRFWVRGEGSFRLRSLQPTISDWDDYGSSEMRASAEWTPVTTWFRDLHQDGWGVSKEFTPQALSGFAIECMPASGYPDRSATGLYRGMIAPLMSSAFRGVIWYQGESNALKADEYRNLLPALIESWRTASRQPDMQFLIVQLPNHGAIPTDPEESAWAELREAELFTAQKVPDTGLAVTIDVGDPKDIHPHRKAEVGERLALWALGATYRKTIVGSGPLYSSMAIDGSVIRIRFTSVGGGLELRGNQPKSFAIAGADRKFHWASARIEGREIVVSSADVNAPVAVRYAWGDSPECSLYNVEGLPASPFRTDEWASQPVKAR